MGLSKQVTEEARLIILRELIEQPNRSMTSSSMRKALLEKFLINQPREWVEDQYEWLESRGAIRVTQGGTVKIATIAPRGLEHLALQAFISGVDSPSQPVL